MGSTYVKDCKEDWADLTNDGLAYMGPILSQETGMTFFNREEWESNITQTVDDLYMHLRPIP